MHGAWWHHKPGRHFISENCRLANAGENRVASLEDMDEEVRL